MATKLGKMVTSLMGSCLQSLMTFDHVVLLDQTNKLTLSYLHYHSAYGHQTWQDGD